MDYSISRNDGNNNDDDDEVCVIVKTVLCDSNNKRNVRSTTYEVCRERRNKNFIRALIRMTKRVQSIRELPSNLALQFAAAGMKITEITECVDRYTVPLLEFLRKSKSLRHVTLRVVEGTLARIFLGYNPAQLEDNGVFLQQLTEAITHNKCIQDVELEHESCFAPQIIASFTGATNIKSFSVRIWDFDGAAAADDGIGIVLHAFQTNRTLEKLSLSHSNYGSEPNNAALVLAALSGHPRIRVLALHACSGICRQHSPVMAALASFVGTAPPTSMEHLSLTRYSFVMEDVTVLLDNLSVTKLTINHCKLDDPSRMKLASYVQASSLLKELALAPCLACDNYMFPDYKDILIGPSSLQVLDLSSAAYCSVSVGGLFMTLGASTDNFCRLLCLHLGRLSPMDWIELTFHLPCQIYLRELHVASVPTGSEARYFMRKIRQNGSLHRVFLISNDGESDNSLGESEMQVLKSVCTRNRILADVLLLTQFDDERSKDGRDPSSSSSHKDKPRHHPSLTPSLLHSACTIPRIGPNMILMHLLSCNESIGLGDCCRKRLRTSM